MGDGVNFEPLDLKWMKNDQGKWDVDSIVAFGCVILFGLTVAFGA